MLQLMQQQYNCTAALELHAEILLLLFSPFLIAEGEMSRSSHSKQMEQLFRDLGVATAKLTHELRIFAAQLMYEMGVSLEVRWAFGFAGSQHTCMAHSC